jgi:NAD(P)-dependent dehydrogenase (short-subunit alcohol dehydrogenase family)
MTAFANGFVLDGKVAIVTGAAAGIGEAVARLLAAQGARVMLVDRDDHVSELAKTLPGAHETLVGDVSSLEFIDLIVKTTEEKFGTIDILVNNAGVSMLNKAVDLAVEQWDRTMSINLRAPFFLSRSVAKVMQKNGGGRIVNIASQAAVIALDKHVSYCASKAGMVSMTQVLAIEWAGDGITVNAVSPTVVETPLGKRAWAGALGEEMKKKIPVGRFAQPEEISAAVLYLVSEHTKIITGANLIIDGGYTIQ